MADEAHTVGEEIRAVALGDLRKLALAFVKLSAAQA